MVFISGAPKGDVLVVRDMPIVLSLIAALVSVGLFIWAYGAEKGGDVQTSGILFAISVAVAGLAAALLRSRTYIIRRNDRTLTIRESRLFQRKTTSHAFSNAAQAELVITKDDEGDDFFQACLTTGEGQNIELDIGSSFATFSARIVFAVNAWLHQPPARGAS